MPDTHHPSDPNDHDTDGQSLWWAIPAAVASVLGIAAAAILRRRQVRAEPAARPQPGKGRTGPMPPLVPLGASPPAGRTAPSQGGSDPSGG